MAGSRFIPWSLFFLSMVAGFTVFPASAWARRNGIAASGCDGCHTGGKPATVSLTANPMNPVVGQPTTVTVTVSATNGAVAGFYLATDYVNPGTLRALETGTLANAAGATHTTPRTGSGGVTTFKVEWTSTVATGVSFSAYALSANGDGTSRGDAGGEAHLSLVTGCAGTKYYIDQDGDGYGSSDPNFLARTDCTQPLSYSAQAGDCNDFDATIHPGASEMCDAKDNNCDGKIDESVVNQAYCEDKDGDGHGILGAATKMDCKPSVGFGDCKGDCNDLIKAVYPGAPEICDGRDNNCDGRIDEGVRMTCGVGWCRRYADGCTSTCTPGPPAKETCNYFDDDCDGINDNGTDAELCGASGLACVLGKCIPADGVVVPGPDGGTGAGNGNSGGSAGGGGRAGTGTGGTGNAGSGAAGTGNAAAGANAGDSGGGSAGHSSSGGGCAILPGAVEPAATVPVLAGVMFFGLGLLRARRRGSLRHALRR